MSMIDDQYQVDLAAAAASYALHAAESERWRESPENKNHAPMHWPWRNEWWKPTDRRSELVKAGALILAEIERLDRANLDQVEGEA